MKRVLVIPYDLNHIGGGSCVAAWALQALVQHHSVSILTWTTPDLDITNRLFGTSLHQRDFRWFTMPSLLRNASLLTPSRMALLKTHILYRKAKQLNRSECFDVVFGMTNEIDVGSNVIQYVHYPWMHWPRPRYDLRWYHFASLMLAYRRMAAGLSGYDQGRAARNLSLANSDWTAARFEECYGVRPRTLYPPVPGGFPEVPFAERDRAFAIVGRIAPEKRIENLIRIVAAVRTRGHDVAVRIIGRAETPAYTEKLAAVAAPHRAWISFHQDLPRHEMVRLIARHRYALHGMAEEHFGIAPAEVQRAGCITFVPNGGGPPEIVGRDERVIFHSAEDAVEKIDRMLRDSDLEESLRRDVEARRLRFTEQRFMSEILAIFDSFGASAPRDATLPEDGAAAQRAAQLRQV